MYYRALHRAQAIREKLGGSGNIALLFPEKPKGMHEDIDKLTDQVAAVTRTTEEIKTEISDADER
jgi:hypothetical protein